jgi:hypothetical protein
VIYRQGAVRRVLKQLAAGEGVAMLIDQHMHSPDAIWVNSSSGLPPPRHAGGDCAAHRRGGGAAAAAAGGGSALGGAVPPGGRRPTPSMSSRSGAPTCWRCRCAGARSCGSGCTAAGATRRHPRRRACSPRWCRGGHIVVVAPNWLSDAVMACRSHRPIFQEAHWPWPRAGGGAALHHGGRRRRGGHPAGHKGGWRSLRSWRDDAAALAAAFDTAVLLPSSLDRVVGARRHRERCSPRAPPLTRALAGRCAAGGTTSADVRWASRAARCTRA